DKGNEPGLSPARFSVFSSLLASQQSAAKMYATGIAVKAATGQEEYATTTPSSATDAPPNVRGDRQGTRSEHFDHPPSSHTFDSRTNRVLIAGYTSSESGLGGKASGGGRTGGARLAPAAAAVNRGDWRGS